MVIAVGGGNFAKTFLNLNKRKFGAPSCPLPGCHGTCATRCNFSNAINFCTQQRPERVERGRGKGSGDCKPAKCEDKVFEPCKLGGRQQATAAASTFCFSHPTWECTN